jgi:hypothetical protein
MNYSYNKRLQFSDEAQRILNLMIEGGCLRVPHNDEPATVVRMACFPENYRQHEGWKDPAWLVVTDAVRDEILESGLVGILTRKRHRHKIGWEEAGQDGSTAEFWCLVQ